MEKLRRLTLFEDYKEYLDNRNSNYESLFHHGTSPSDKSLIVELNPNNGPITIGRDRNCDLVLPYNDVSRFHAKIFPKRDEINNNSLYIIDNLSTNGTHIRKFSKDLNYHTYGYYEKDILESFGKSDGYSSVELGDNKIGDPIIYTLDGLKSLKIKNCYCIIFGFKDNGYKLHTFPSNTMIQSNELNNHL